MTQIKICGNTNAEDAKLAASLGADYLGLIFAESKRKITVPKAQEIMQAVPGFENFVGVFMNQPKDEVELIIAQTGLKTLQFHGEETSLYCRYFLDKGFKVIKTFHIKDAMSLKRIDEYDATAFLFDTYSGEGGGSGQVFDWSLIQDRPFVHEQLFLAGGLNPENVRSAIEKVKPFAVDIASGVEKEPGKKDPAKLKQFIQLVKENKPLHAQKPTIRP